MKQNKSIEEVIETLTHDGEYASEICLMLYLTENYTSLHYLEYLDITGKDLETLAYGCCDQSSVDYLTQTIRFLRSGFLGKDEIKENIKSTNPVYFINRLINKGEDWEYVYEEYAGEFRSAMNKSKGR